MIMDPNNITINFAKNPELKEAFSMKKSGDTCSFTIKMQVNEQDENEVRGSIEVIELEEHKDEDAVEPSKDEPVMVVIAASKSKRTPTEEPVEAGY